MEKKSKFGWLWHNQLFRTTPLVGYGFIELAQSKVEVIFWYLTIIGFTIAAAVNMHFAYVEYSSKPTHTLVYPTARSDNLFVPNFTIKFELPTFELYNDNPTKAYRKYDSFAMPAEETGLSRYLICHILQGISQDDPVSVYANIYSVFAKLTETVDIADVEERRAAPSELSFKGNLQRWKIIQDPLYEDIVEYLDNNIDSPRERFVYDSEREKIEGLLGGALRARPHDVYGQLEILRRVTEDTNETFRSSVKRTAAQIHSSAIDALNHLFHIEVKHPKSRVSLSDWTYSTNGDEWVVLGFTADVELPQGEIELEIQLYSYFYRWLQQIHRAIDTFAQMYPLQKKDEPRKLCYAGDSSYSSLIAMTDNELLNFGYIATKSDFHLTMNNVNGEYDRAVMQQNYGVIELNPKATFTSKINNCYKSSYEECITDCMVKLSLESCVCLPWHLYRRRLHSHLSICSKPCIVKETKTEICTNDCATNSRHPCLLNQYGIDSYSHSRLLEKSKQFEAFDLPLHAMKIKLAQGIIHPSIFEEYQFTWGKYIANLGQILEFWIGLSILALIHLFVYTIKQIRKIQFKKESVTDDNKPTQLSDEINIETAKKLYEKEVKDIRNMIEPQSDGFLQQTILTGFNLIGAADTKLEKGFWWVIVAVFFAITAISIERSIYSYNVAATHTMVLPSRSSAEITISNMTLHLGLPLHDFINHNLLELGNLMKLKTNRNSVSNSLVCASIAYGASHPKTMMEVADQTLSDEITTKWTKGIFEEWHDLIEISHQTSTTIDFADSQSREFDRWRNDMNKAKQALLSFLKTKKDTKMPNTNADTKKLNAEVENLLNSVFKQRKNDTHFKLMFLESLKTNQDPRIKLWSLLNELKMTETLPAKSSFNNTPNSMLLTEPRTLLLDALADLKKFVNIKIHGASNTRIFLTDWAYFMKSNRHNKAIGAGLALISNPSMMDNMHEFTFDLLVPDDVHQMKVEIRTFTNQWHTYIEETFNEYLAWLQLNHAASYLDWTQDCEFKNILTDDLFKYSKIYREMIRTSAFVRIKMHNGYNSQVWLNPMFNAKYDAQVHNTFNAIKIQSCDKDTTEECMLKCMVESYMSSCSCVPLKYYYYSYGETSLCDGTCHAKTSCEEECNRNYCSLQLYELAKTAYNNLISPLFTIEINTQTPHFHQVFETEYVTGQSQLVYTIIGHLELWLGFNIIAVLHVIVYMCKKLASYVRKRRNIIQSTEYKTETDWKSVQGELSKISQSISSEIKRLERQNNVRNSWKKRFKWLHRNKFFDETPLSGFSFVSNAKTIVEVLLWYSVLCLFVGLMLYNVTGLLNSYLSRPTKRHVLTMQNNIQFENMTITIELPFIEFITTSLLKDRFKKMIKITNTQTKSSKLPWLNQYLACYVIDPQLLNYHAHNYYHEQRIRFVESHCIDIVKGKWKTASQNVKDENLPGVPDISCRKMLNLWKKKLSEGAANVLEYLLSNYNATTDSLLDPSNIVPTLTTMEGLLDGPLKWREQYAAFKFMLLASLEQAFDPIAKLAAISLQWMINMDTYTPSYNNAENYLKMLDINSSQLLRSVQTELGKTLHVDIVNIEGARVFLRQWNYSTTSIYQDFQTVSLELFLPANVTELRIEIRSFMRMWQRYLLGAFSHYFDYLAQHHPDYYQAQVRCDSGQLLHDPSKERDLIRDEQMLSDYNFETAIPTIILQPHGRPKLGVRHDEYITEILAQPSFQFLSQTDQCSMEPSNQACIEKCVNKLYGNICKCYPWGLYYLNQDSTTNVCTKPCKKADFESRKNKCEEECDKAQERPCKLNMYSMVEADPTTKVLKPTDDPLDQPMYILSLKFANNMFPQYIEEYSMKFTDFLSELGGILEFWLGINIVALLHLGVFLVKFCNEKRRTTGKGKSEKSTETEASKETQEIRKFEQEVNDEMQYLQDEIQKKIGQY